MRKLVFNLNWSNRTKAVSYLLRFILLSHFLIFERLKVDVKDTNQSAWKTSKLIQLTHKKTNKFSLNVEKNRQHHEFEQAISVTQGETF